jgi:hypothetical protein
MQGRSEFSKKVGTKTELLGNKENMENEAADPITSADEARSSLQRL